MDNEILDFINRRWKDGNEIFLSGNCYWFAKILKDRFDYLEIYYLPVEGHFVAFDKSDDSMYDASGLVSYNGPKISFENLKEIDESWHNRLIRDCIM